MGKVKDYLYELVNEVLDVYEQTPRFYCGYRNLLDEYYDKYCTEFFDEEFDTTVFLNMQSDIMCGGMFLDRVIDNLSMAINKSYDKCYNSENVQRISLLKNKLKQLRKGER